MQNRVLCVLVVACLLRVPASAQTRPQLDPAVEKRVDALLAKLSTEQKLELIGGVNDFYLHAEPNIGLPALRMADGPVGVRDPGPSPAYLADIALAATFDTELAFEEGEALGRDARSRGVSFLLGPGVNIYRAPMNSRNFEYFGEDPFLASRMAVAYIEGVQKQGISATVKHFALNNEEYDRHNLDSFVDERTLHEIYLPAFEAAVKEAHVRAVMNSYNRVNGEYATQNTMLNLNILKRDWGFSGVLMSDWRSVYDGLGAANGGLDVEMPSAKFMMPELIGKALSDGRMTESTLDDKVRRILRVAVEVGWIDHPLPSWVKGDPLPKEDDQTRMVTLRGALESITLLRNSGQLLPLDAGSMCTLAVIGPNADKPVTGGGGSSHVGPIAALSMVQALTVALPSRKGCPGVVYVRGIPTDAEVFRSSKFEHGVEEELFTGPEVGGTAAKTRHLEQVVPTEKPSPNGSPFHSARWTAEFVPEKTGPVSILVGPGMQDGVQLAVDGKQVLALRYHENQHPPVGVTVDGVAGQPLRLVLTAQLKKNDEGIGLGIKPSAMLVSDEARKLAAKAEAVIVAAGFNMASESESFDRPFELPIGQDELIQEVAALNPRTVVTVNAGGGFAMPWIEKTPALLHLWYPGEEGATALADILFGKSSPEGHLPISIERRFADNPTHDSYYPAVDSTAGHPKIHLTEGVFLGYRYYAGTETKPLFPFGFGLSYTRFTFSNLKAEVVGKNVVVTVDVKNTGARSGGDAVQVYVGDPSATVKRPVEELKAFRKLHLGANERTHLSFTLDRRAFAWWNPQVHDWQVDPGRFTIMVGDSSDHLSLRTDVTLKP